MDAIFRAVFALIAILGFSCLAGLLIILLLMTASTIRETIRNWRDHHDIRRYWDMVDHEADVGPVDPIAFHLIQFRNNIATLRLLGRKVDPERWRKYALWYPVDRKEGSRHAQGQDR